AADIAPLAGTVVKLLRRSMPEGLKLEVDAGEKPLRAWVDASQLQDALVNMILNARDAKASRVTVRTAPAVLTPERAEELQATPGPCVRIDVADDGQGMDAATRARVFEPFFTTKRHGAGTGLGMSMVYGFVRQSGGAIDIDSALGRGTVVSLWLPVAAGAERADIEVEAAGAERVAGRSLALLVEDDPDVRKVVRRSLIDLGFAVVEAENGTEAMTI
ncbi:MAG: ATP-binding protein, partial [Rhodocyclaceae bacterium]|nr:ATP-binding protein [Rhodocyclaceae bacterium]